MTVSFALARFLGYDSPEELVGRPALDIVHPDDRPYIAERIQSIYETRVPSSPAAQRLLRRDGSTVFVEIPSLPVIVEGQAGAFTIVRPMRGDDDRPRNGL